MTYPIKQSTFSGLRPEEINGLGERVAFVACPSSEGGEEVGVPPLRVKEKVRSLPAWELVHSAVSSLNGGGVGWALAESPGDSIAGEGVCARS